MPISVRPIIPDDVPFVLACIEELAVFERLTHQLDLDEVRFREHLFGERPIVEGLIGERDGEPAGYALFFPTYSTFRIRPGLWLEDLYVRESDRDQGVGTALLQAFARLAVDRGCARCEWSVLDWNENAIKRYRNIGADVMPDWRICRLDGMALEGFAGRTD